jgi:hypothetical protein
MPGPVVRRMASRGADRPPHGGCTPRPVQRDRQDRPPHSPGRGGPRRAASPQAPRGWHPSRVEPCPGLQAAPGGCPAGRGPGQGREAGPTGGGVWVIRGGGRKVEGRAAGVQPHRALVCGVEAGAGGDARGGVACSGGRAGGGGPSGVARRRPVPEPAPNQALEPTPRSVRCAPASGRGSPPAFGYFRGQLLDHHSTVVRVRGRARPIPKKEETTWLGIWRDA